VSHLFNEHWWLDAAAPGDWGEAVVQQADRVVARLPWARERLAVPLVRLQCVGAPKLTPRLLPELDTGDGKPVTRLTREHQLLDQLIEQLPGFDYLTFTFASSFTNPLPFIWHGCDASVRISYVLPDIADCEVVWSNMSESTRRAIRKGERELEVVDDHDTERLCRAVRQAFERQEKKLPFSPELLRRIHRAAASREAGQILTAVDGRGRTHASLLLVWDDRRAYYLTGGADPELRSSGAQSLLLWEAIKRAAKTSASFDFEGSMTEGIARFFRGFGAEPERYLHVTAFSRRARAGKALVDLARAVRGT